jgi:hypothetical protein
MNFIKKLSLLATLVAVMFVFNACDEDTTGPDDSNAPGAPVSLMATSTNANTVTIKWSAPGDLDGSLFQDYTVTYYPSNAGPENAPDTTVVLAGEPVQITGLDADKVYTFAVTTNYSNGESSTATTIEWAPAMRFETVDANTIKIYASDVAAAGSGINLYQDDGLGDFLPTVLTVADIAQWNLGLDTKENGTVKFGSANQLTYTGAASAIYSAEMSAVIKEANSLNDPDVFDSQALDAKTYSQRVEDLSMISLTGKSGVVFYVRVPSTTAGSYNYAKLFVKAVDGKFLQGDGDKYIEVTVSYQANTNFPYAKK